MATFENIPERLSNLDNFLSEHELRYDLKPEAEAKIVWHTEATPKQTDYAIVYLHGFRATRREGYPVHLKIARKLGCNLFLARLEEHGINSDHPLLNLTEEKLLNSARFAFEIGRRIGKKVVLMGTSTGASLSLFLAAQQELKQNIEALVLYSPLINFFGLREKLLTQKWFRKMLELFPGSDHLLHHHQGNKIENQIWYNSYALQGALSLGAFVQHYMNKDLFSKIKCPVFTGYYYKNYLEQDQVVSVAAVKKMVRELGTLPKFRTTFNFSHAKTHVICSNFLSGSVEEVIKETYYFLKPLVRQ